MPIIASERYPAPTGTPFIRRMISRGEFAPGAWDMNDHDALGQWVSANAADRVALTFTNGSTLIGTIEVIPPKVNNHGGVVHFREDRRGQKFPRDLILSEGDHWSRQGKRATPPGVAYLELLDA